MVFICYSSMIHIISIYYVLRSWVLCEDFFLDASKILFYILTYTVCQVLKGLLPTSKKRNIDVSELLRFSRKSPGYFQLHQPVFKLSFNKLLQSKNYRKGVFLINEWVDFFFKRGSICIPKGKKITAIDLISKNMLGKYIFQVVPCILKGLI